MKRNIFIVAAAATAIILLAVVWFSGCGTALTQTNTKTPDTNTMQAQNETPFSCAMNALTADERTRLSALTKDLLAKKQEVKELPDGYAMRYAMDAETFRNAAEFVTYERKCCPFFEFDLTAERENGSMWLTLKGREGVKEFIKAEFGIK